VGVGEGERSSEARGCERFATPIVEASRRGESERGARQLEGWRVKGVVGTGLLLILLFCYSALLNAC
jgi:hypothetical protein